MGGETPATHQFAVGVTCIYPYFYLFSVIIDSSPGGCPISGTAGHQYRPVWRLRYTGAPGLYRSYDMYIF